MNSELYNSKNDKIVKEMLGL